MIKWFKKLKPKPFEIGGIVNEAIEKHYMTINPEINRLRTIEEEYKRLLTMIKVCCNRDVYAEDITIKITKWDLAYGKTWEEIVILAKENKVN